MVIPAPRLKFYRRVRSLAPLVAGKPDGVERLVKGVLHLWQRTSYPCLAAKRAPYGSSGFLDEEVVQDFAAWLSGEPFNEAAYWLATTYAVLVGDKIRAERALYFTPPRLANRVIDVLLEGGASLTKQHWHDPACGGAAFLVPIAQRMASSLAGTGLSASQQLDHIEHHLSGNDLDPVLLEISREFLRMALSGLLATTARDLSLRLFKGDGLTSSVIEKLQLDVLACNPPYRKLKASEVDRYRKTHGDVIEGQPNIYGLFINRTLQLAKKGALIGLLTPTSFLSGQSFSKLRTKLLTHADTLHVDMLSDRNAMFIDVEQETAITVLRTRTASKIVDSKTRVSVLKPEGEFEDVGEFLLPNSGRPWPIPRAASDAGLLQSAENVGFTLSDYGYVARVGHLVAYRDERQRFAQQPAAKPDRLVVPLVWATDITPDGRFDHGRECRYSRDRRFVQISSLTDHGVITNAAVLLQRLTSSDQKRRLVAAAVPEAWVAQFGGYVCENHVIVLEPVSKDAMPPEKLAAILNTQPVDRIFRAVSGSSNVAVSELEQLLLPDPAHLKRVKKRGTHLDDAVRTAYRIAS
ncbi:MAG: Eco57I restriction-modification methylase domain-containing protein [Hylemonella sp.]|uniref:Eco57I restriction-modification methylase domain-containing protein n=1 Tax=Hylemonella sp. TaxID=2066020 RepID=UPI0022C8AB9E|nr:Eco57I restriction-modification methylase domain-containing protein [Hylemonella sp.]MCZ8251728.1 Eco57I restriction-modification methylase domain-containing protein [Hylemonella sp.]